MPHLAKRTQVRGVEGQPIAVVAMNRQRRRIATRDRTHSCSHSLETVSWAYSKGMDLRRYEERSKIGPRKGCSSAPPTHSLSTAKKSRYRYGLSYASVPLIRLVTFCATTSKPYLKSPPSAVAIVVGCRENTEVCAVSAKVPRHHTHTHTASPTTRREQLLQGVSRRTGGRHGSNAETSQRTRTAKNQQLHAHWIQARCPVTNTHTRTGTTAKVPSHRFWFFGSSVIVVLQ